MSSITVSMFLLRRKGGVSLDCDVWLLLLMFYSAVKEHVRADEPRTVAREWTVA